MKYSDSVNNDDQIIIDLKELIWRLLEQWKAIIALGIIVAILFSGFMYTKNTEKQFNALDTENADSIINDMNDTENADSIINDMNDTENADNILNDLKDEDQTAILSVWQEYKAKANIQEYVNSSLLMRMDPYDVKVLSMIWAVNSDESINKQIMASYINKLSSKSVVESINESWGSKYEINQIKELISAKSTIPVESEAVSDKNVLNIVVYIPEDEDALTAEDCIKRAVSSINEDLNTEIGEHQISLINSDVRVTSDDYLSSLQYSVYSRYNNLVNYAANLRDKLSPEQKEIYDNLLASQTAEEAAGKADGTDKESVPTDSEGSGLFNKKWIIIGFVLGCIAYIGLYFIIYALSTVIRSPIVAERTYGIRTLGEWYSRGKAGILAFMLNDPWIYKKHHKGHLDMEVEAKRISESAANAFQGIENGSLLFVNDCGDSDDAMSFIEAVKTELSKRGIVTKEADINISEGVYIGEDTIRSSHAVAMILRNDKSNLKSAKDVCSKCYFCDRPVLGAAYIG